MQLYAGMSKDFISETVRNQIAETLRTAFSNYYRYQPSPAEVSSWRNSLRAMKDVMQVAALNDHGVLLEYQLPLSSKRLDCMVCGLDERASANAVIVELKQWDKCEDAEPENVVRTWVGGGHREVLHPSVQVGQYRLYLEDTHTAFHDGDDLIALSACSYLHNYALEERDPLLAPKFAQSLEHNPVFDRNGVDDLAQYLSGRMAKGRGESVRRRIEETRFRPSLKLMEHVSDTIKAQAPWVLLDEQLVVYEHIRAAAADAERRGTKQVIIVRGGPGTGKSVLALNLMAEFMRRGINAQHATGSKAFTETLWKMVGRRAKATFKFFNNFQTALPNEVDVLICDEAHRIRTTSSSRFTPKHLRTETPQVRELLDAARTAVFFLDDRQTVRPKEIGSSALIREEAAKTGATISEFELEVQFRCAGSDGFIKWIENTIGIQRTANVLWDGSEGFDFRIMPSPLALEMAIRAHADRGNSARVAAGFCWPWSEPREDGTLVDDIVIGSYVRPWDAKPGSRKLAPGIPPAALWASDPNGINQIGCVYNIQGFELDYIGVIWGRDLRYDLDKQEWIGDKKASADRTVKQAKEGFVDLVKNTYRVLLSRGLKGCYVTFLDKDTERFVRSRMEVAYHAEPARKVAERVRPPYGGESDP